MGTCKVVRPSSNRVNPRYLHHFFQSTGYRRKVSSLAAGANINNLKNEHIDELLLPLPPLEEQRRIAAILDRAAKVREQATQSLGSSSRALYESIFSRDILAVRHRMARIGDIAMQLPSGYGSDPGRLPFGAPVAKVSNITADGRFHREFESRSFTQPEINRLLVGEHDLLVVKSSSSKANIISGKTAICGKNHAGVLVASNFLMRLCVDQSTADPRFVWHVLNSKISKDFVKRVAGTTTYPNLKWSTYVDHPIPLPSLSEQRLIRERLDHIDALSHEKGARLAEEAGNLIAVLQQQLIGR
ncbi:restriction endonuclease subunit S [Cyanobium sp. FGCU-52]|nr:restriction endonuclease subunit S [Cyanobium sp. FGCU52]